jgi:hypothetical protein
MNINTKNSVRASSSVSRAWIPGSATQNPLVQEL